jgi:hypothetical protein
MTPTVTLTTQLSTMRSLIPKAGKIARAMNMDRTPSEGQIMLLLRDMNATIATLEWLAKHEDRIRAALGPEARA